MRLSLLPPLNAILNGLSAVLLVTGLCFIKRKNREAHRRCMISALVVSSLFLISYLTYHFQEGTTRYLGTGWMRTLYFTILTTHTILAATVPPLAIVTLSTISLETPIGEDQDSRLRDFIEDRAVASPVEAIISLNLKEQTQALLETLTLREEKVLKMRFGVGDGLAHTLEEVGQSFALSRERIRQIESKALLKLRDPSRSRQLRAFLEGSNA